MQTYLKKSIPLLGLSLLLTGCLDPDSFKDLYLASPKSAQEQTSTAQKRKDKKRQLQRDAERVAQQRRDLANAQRQAEIEKEMARHERQALEIQREVQQRLDLQEAQRRAEEQAQNARQERMALEAVRNAEIQAQNARRERLALEAQQEEMRRFERQEAERQAALHAEQARQIQLAEEAERAEQQRIAQEEEMRRVNEREALPPPTRPQQDAPLSTDQQILEELPPAVAVVPAEEPLAEHAPAIAQELAAEQPERAPAAPAHPWEPNSEDLRLGGEAVMHLQRDLGRVPSHAEMLEKIVAVQGLTTEQAEAVLEMMGLE